MLHAMSSSIFMFFQKVYPNFWKEEYEAMGTFPCFQREEVIPPNHWDYLGDQDRISPYIINVISSRKMMRIRKTSISGLPVDSISNSPN